MMVAASNQLAELLDDVGLVARIESGRWEPNVQEVDSLELARNAADAVEEHASTATAGRSASTGTPPRPRFGSSRVARCVTAACKSST